MPRIEFYDMLPGEPCYSFVATDGQNTHIASGRLRQWCLAQGPALEVFLVPIVPALLRRFRRENTVCPDRVLELAKRRLPFAEPILIAKWEQGAGQAMPDVLLVDGHHRYVLAGLAKSPYINAWVLDPAQWRPFEIVGHPDMTQQELVAVPPRLGRTY